MKTYLHNRNHSCNFRISRKAGIYKRVMAVMALAVMVAGTSLSAAASDQVKSSGNIRFENGTPEDSSDDVFFCAEDLHVLNDKVEEMIITVTEGKNGIAKITAQKGSPVTAGSTVPTFDELSQAIGSIGINGTAGTSDILTGKTVYDGFGYVTGTMPNKAGTSTAASVSSSGATGTVNIPANGYYDTNSKLTFNIGSMISLNGNATPSAVLSGSTFYSNSLTRQTGSMPNNGAINGTLNCGESKTIPAGYTSGGRITANSLASQTQGTATADNISNGMTAWVNGQLVTGNGKDVSNVKVTPVKISLLNDYVYEQTNIDIKNFYTDYNKLTIDDFGYEAYLDFTLYQGDGNPGNHKEIDPAMSYDPNTGILTVEGGEWSFDTEGAYNPKGILYVKPYLITYNIAN